MMKNSKKQAAPDFWAYARSFLHTYLPKVRNLSQHTIASYKQSLTFYINYMETEIGIDRQNITFDCLSRKHQKLSRLDA
ncbi:site-specific integrase [Effusibacillus consociatus]|uniref:Site-specific integrase n=1 Tax=Effusibacillus consociatus TaxID=1117041 RepID=A0ABV9Q0A8_9BACL